MTTHITDMRLPSLNKPSEAPVGAMGIETDEFLLGRLREHDASAGEKLVMRYHEPLMRYLHRISGQMGLAEELHQQTWMSVLEHLEKFDPASSAGGFKAWIFRIATNKANDLWRSRGRQKKAYTHLAEISETDSPHAGHRIEASDDEIRMREAIARLPDQQRQVVMLRYYSGLKFVEIAETLGCPLNTALGRMHKAMMKLKEMLQA